MIAASAITAAPSRFRVARVARVASSSLVDCRGLGTWDRIPSNVRVTDVSPRDGLQNEPTHVDTTQKLDLISRLRSAGVASIEATSFVSPKAVPQMADAREVMRSLQLDTSINYAALVPNLRGLEAAAESGVREVTVLAAATETMSRRNTNCSLEEALRRASDVIVAATAKGMRARGAIAVSMVCPFEGDVPESQLVPIVEKLYAQGCYEILICDTIGAVSPLKTRKVLEAIQASGVPTSALALHFHDTYGQAVANMLVGLQMGISSMDAAVGGTGGCPFAGPGCSGNLATEDLIYMLHGLGIHTGIDLEQLSHTGDWICGVLGRPNGTRAGSAVMLERRRRLQATGGGLAKPASVQARCMSTSRPRFDITPKERVPARTGPLAKYRVIELGNFLAGPFCATTLGYFGADVIKVETPGKGDPIRYWRSLAADGQSPWSRSILRNKRSITVNLKHPDGVDIIRKLMNSADVVVENFKPGVLEKFKLGPDDFKTSNPGLIFARISGYGQTGPYKSRAGFASATEGEGGFRYVNGFPGQAPVRPNLSMGDSLAGTQAALGVVMALLNREKTGRGQIVDMALYEAMFNMMEGLIPDYSCLGVVRQPSGTTVSGIVPTNTHKCSDGKYVIIGANADALFSKFMKMIGRSDMADDERYANNAGRVQHQEYIYEVIDNWCASMPSAEVLAKTREIGCPVGPIYDAADIMNDPHYIARGMFEDVQTPTGINFKIPAIVPKLSETPGNTEWCGPEVGAHNHQVLSEYLGMDDADIARLRSDGAIGSECC